MSHDNITTFIGGTPLEPPTCDCETSHNDCLFGLECSEITAVLTSFCWDVLATPCPVIAQYQQVTLILSYSTELSTASTAVWTIGDEEISTVSYDVDCGWSSSFHCDHVAYCLNECQDLNPNWATYSPSCFCEDVPFPCPPCDLCGLAFPKDIEEFIGDDEIAEALGCDEHECNLGVKVADISLSTPCKNTNLACTGFRAYTAICVAMP